LMEKLGKLEVGPKESQEVLVSAAEFVLEGLHAHKRIGRNEERVFTAGEKQPKHTEKPFEREDAPYRPRRSFN
jgi:magnesium chelatase subunit I